MAEARKNTSKFGPGWADLYMEYVEDFCSRIHKGVEEDLARDQAVSGASPVTSTLEEGALGRLRRKRGYLLKAEKLTSFFRDLLDREEEPVVSVLESGKIGSIEELIAHLKRYHKKGDACEILGEVEVIEERLCEHKEAVEAIEKDLKRLKLELSGRSGRARRS